MNYIRHLNTFFYYVKRDTSLTAMHVSLYMGLFQVWNSNRFRQPFPVFRDQVMQLSRIGSKNTYHKCLKELHTAGYIHVQPGLSKYMPAKIYMRDFEKHVPPVVQSDLFEAEAVAGGEDQSGGEGHSDSHCHSQGQSHSHKPSPIAITTSTHARLSPFELSEAISRSSPSDRRSVVTGVCKPLGASGGGPLAGDTTRAGNSLPMGEGRGGASFPMGEGRDGAISEPVSVPDSTSNPPKTDTRTVPDLRPLDKPINIIKEGKTTRSVPIKKKPKERKGSFPPGSDEVEAFFREQGQSPTEARKFYLYYQSIGWRVQGGTTPITDWKATAEKWILNDKTFNNHADTQRNSKTPPNPYYTRADKDYSEPL